MSQTEIWCSLDSGANIGFFGHLDFLQTSQAPAENEQTGRLFKRNAVAEEEKHQIVALR